MLYPKAPAFCRRRTPGLQRWEFACVHFGGAYFADGRIQIGFRELFANRRGRHGALPGVVSWFGPARFIPIVGLPCYSRFHVAPEPQFEFSRFAKSNVMKSILRAAFFLLFWLCLPALVFPPPASGAIFGEVTVKDEIEMGKKFNEMVAKRMQMVTDPEVLGYVTRVVNRVVKAMPPQPFPIKVAVLNNAAMNAFAVPGGYVYIFSGLMLNIHHESELAGIIGHELGHVHLRHVARRIEHMQLINLGALVGMLSGAFLGAATGGQMASNLGGALLVGSQAGAASAFLGYTRQMEREADNTGYKFMVDAGYNPQSMVSAFELMRKKQWYMGGGSIPSYLATHPGLSERIGYIKDRIARDDPSLTRREDDDEAFLRVQALLRAELQDPQVALTYYKGIPEANMTCMDHLGLGLVNERIRNMAKAGRELDKAAACAPSDPAVNREIGRFWFERGQYQKAGRYLQKAVILNPHDFTAMYYYARLLTEIGQGKSALAFYKQVIQARPRDANIRYHYGRVLGSQGHYFEAHLQLAYAALASKDPKKARFHMDKAAALAQTEEQKKELEALQKEFDGLQKGGGGSS
jgi:predicted Zn-dependent protease